MQLPDSIKIQLYNKCLHYANDRILSAQMVVNEAMQAGNNETKSSAGDKHETARAMAQLEQEKASKHLHTAAQLKQQLTKINPNLIHTKIAIGSVVETNVFNFYISIAAGKMELGGKNYIAISPNSPIAGKLIGLKASDQIEINSQSYQIIAVL